MYRGHEIPRRLSQSVLPDVCGVPEVAAGGQSPELLQPELCCRFYCIRNCCRSYRRGPCPYRLGSEFSCHPSFLCLIVEMVLLGPLLVPSRVVLVFSLRPQGVPSRTCIVRVFLPSQLDTAGTGKNCCSRKSVHGSAAAGISAAGSAASGSAAGPTVPVLVQTNIGKWGHLFCTWLVSSCCHHC